MHAIAARCPERAIEVAHARDASMRRLFADGSARRRDTIGEALTALAQVLDDIALGHGAGAVGERVAAVDAAAHRARAGAAEAAVDVCTALDAAMHRWIAVQERARALSVGDALDARAGTDLAVQRSEAAAGVGHAGRRSRWRRIWAGVRQRVEPKWVGAGRGCEEHEHEDGARGAGANGGHSSTRAASWRAKPSG